MECFVEVDWLAARLGDPNVVVVDARGAPLTVYYANLGREQYLGAHIPGAIHLDYAIDLQDPKTTYATRVAEPGRFADVVGAAGIGNDTTVIAYDSGELPYAARMVWMLRYYGLESAAVLNGGIEAWIESGRTRDSVIPSLDRKRFAPRVRPELRATKEEVLDVAQGRRDAQLLSVSFDTAYAMRAREIPNAHRLSASRLLDELHGGRLAPLERLREVTNDLDPQKRTITFCGNGVTAAGAFVALVYAGFTDVAVYDGSLAEWLHDGLPTIAKET